MATSKDRGGLGFRELYLFNLAMLGKQLCRLQNYPNSLATKIFKAKYFPRGTIESAKIGYQPNYL